jgi:hypothetical protein
LIRQGGYGVGVLNRDWPWLVGVALLVGTAMSIAAYALGSGTTTVALMSMALIALALAQVLGLMRSHLGQGALNKLADNQENIMVSVNRLGIEARRINNENIVLGHNVEQFRAEAATLNASVTESLTSLRQSHEEVADSLRTILDVQRDIQTNLQTSSSQTAMKIAIEREQAWMAQMTDVLPEPEKIEEVEAPEEEPPVASFENSGLAEALHLSLEPIVDLYTLSLIHI